LTKGSTTELVENKNINSINNTCFDAFLTNSYYPSLLSVLCKSNSTKINILFDSGGSKSIVTDKLIPQNARKHQQQSSVWTRVAGKFETSNIALFSIKIPVLHESRIRQCNMHVTSNMRKYDVIVGRDLLQDLGIIINFRDKTIEWEHGSDPIPHFKSDSHDLFKIESERKPVIEATNRVKSIIDAKYEKANLDELVTSCTQLSNLEQQQLLQLPTKHEAFFDGSLGHWKDQPYDIKLKDGIKPYHVRPYPIAKIHESALKQEVDSL
jgi:hypothetical protein